MKTNQVFNIDLSKYNQSNYDRGKNGIIIILWWIIQGTVFRYSLHNAYKWRAFLLRLFGAKIGRNTKIRSSASFYYPWKITIGDNTWIGDNVTLYSLDKIIIESNCVISQKSYLCTGSHEISSEHFQLVTKPIIIGKGVWIASDVFIYPGITVEEYAVVAARSTVTKCLSSMKVYAGSPAKYIKDRI